MCWCTPIDLPTPLPLTFCAVWDVYISFLTLICASVQVTNLSCYVTCCSLLVLAILQNALTCRFWLTANSQGEMISVNSSFAVVTAPIICSLVNKLVLSIFESLQTYSTHYLNRPLMSDSADRWTKLSKQLLFSPSIPFITNPFIFYKQILNTHASIHI